MKSVSIFAFLIGIVHSFSLVAASFSLPDFAKQLSNLPEDTLHFYPSLVTFDQLRIAGTTFRAHRTLDYRKNALENSQAIPHVLYAQKLIIKPQSTVLFFGDLHGNAHSLARLLNKCVENGFINKHLKITNQNTYMIFLGDYVDRGFYSVEVLYMLLQLANNNPHNVILLRGNHEDERLNATFGFKQELNVKFSSIAQSERTHIVKTFDLMPSVLYLGSGNAQHTDYIQCCHGGLEIGYNPQTLLKCDKSCCYQSITKLERTMPIRLLNTAIKQEVIAQLPAHEICDCAITAPTNPINIGLLWNDFIEKETAYRSPIVNYHEGRGWVLGQKLTKHILSSHSSDHATIHSIFRAHQHHGAMRSMLAQNHGLVSLWDGLVYTFVSAHNLTGNPASDSFGILKIGHQFSEWQLQQCVLNGQTLNHELQLKQAN